MIGKRKEIIAFFVRCRKDFRFWELFFYGGILLFIAFCASRGEFHTDTGIYHAQMIRLYEEYGLLRGMGNLQLHFAYNSAYLAFASLFSMKWLVGQSLHTTTGFLEALFCLYALHGLRDFGKHKRHTADLMKVGILFYTFTVLDRCMSPATDYSAMLFSLFLIAAWCDTMEREKALSEYCLLSVLAVFTVTLKLSAGFLVIVALYPAWLLLKDRKWKEIAFCIGGGLAVLLPFLVRNYLISGWLLYPFQGIDLFSVKWKVPEEYLIHDAEQIKVWARCLYDVTKTDWSITRWFPVWWEHQRRDEKMLMGAVVFSMLLLALVLLRKKMQKEQIDPAFLILLAAIAANGIMWFMVAPFIRYGLAFLLSFCMLAFGMWLSERGRGLYCIAAGGLVFLVFLSMTPFLDNYVTELGVFVKHNLTEPYYIRQKDYDDPAMGSVEIGGNRIWYALEEDRNSYHYFPASCYKDMLTRSTLMGDTIEDGFMPITE
ncbi:MAG: hypothetical protein NC302_06780 [Bacteroidales bacterium]|nr:hypothetical protein [Bacteroidales bacterium]MCM1415404.1 hypothetical protein [bacterium]MCM1423337.1 hypothetical protein [bacterium]